MGSKAILARHDPDDKDHFIKWQGNGVLTDGTPDVVVPSLIRLRNATTNDYGSPKFIGPRDMTKFLIDDYPGGWHSLHTIDWTLPPEPIFTMNNNDIWRPYLKQKHKQPLYLPLDGLPLTNASRFYGYWAYVIVEDLDILAVMAKYPDDWHEPRWTTVGTYPLFSSTGRVPRVPRYEVWAQRAKDALYMRPDDYRLNLENL